MIFSAFERMVAFRYLRARRQEGFVSVIAIFSLLGIALGVATLIIVMSVMNGFRADLLARILGIRISRKRKRKCNRYNESVIHSSSLVGRIGMVLDAGCCLSSRSKLAPRIRIRKYVAPVQRSVTTSQATRDAFR